MRATEALAAIATLGLTGGLARAEEYDLIRVAGDLPSGDGTATTLQLHFVNDVELVPGGGLLVPGYYSSAVWEVAPDGVATVVAGVPGEYGYDGDGGAATAARFSAVADIVRAPDGSLYIADVYNFAVRRVDGVTGDVEVVAGTGVPPYAIDGPGGDPADDPGDGVAATAVAMTPLCLSLHDGALYVTDIDGNRIYAIDLGTGIADVFAGTGVPTYAIDGPGGDPADELGDGGLARDATVAFGYGGGMGFGADGAAYLADTSNQRVRRIDGDTGIITTIAGTGEPGDGGDGGLAVEAQLADPYAIAVGADGAVYVTDSGNNRIRRIAGGMIATVAGTGSFGAHADDGELAVDVPMAWPRGLQLAPDGALLVADSFAQRVRRIDLDGRITTVAGRLPGDGGQAADAMLNGPGGLSVRLDGAILIADSNHYRIRQIDSSGRIITMAGTGEPGFGGDGGLAVDAQMRLPLGIAVDPTTGDVYFSDMRQHRVRRINTDSTIDTVAGTGARGSSGDGGPAANAELAVPLGLAVDTSGDVYIADGGNNRIRRIDHATGEISTYAGTGEEGYDGDGGPAADARLTFPDFLAFDADGNLYFTEDSHVVRRIDRATGTITTVAGTGTPGFSGDGGPATAAELEYPGAIVVSDDGAIWFVDAGVRIRRIDPDGTIETVAGNGDAGRPAAEGEPALSAPLLAGAGLTIGADGKILVTSDDRLLALVEHVEPEPGPDAGADQPDAGETPIDDGGGGGCGCRTGDGGPGAGALMLGALALVIGRARARRRGRA